jgi:hypothetical protein
MWKRIHTFRRSAAITLVACLAAGLSAGVPASAATEALVSLSASARAKEFAGHTTQVLPTRSYRHADGSVETVVDPKALQALIAMAPSRPCGRQCDGKDPATYLVQVPGDAYYCANDALTVKWYVTDYSSVELRYSPICRTAWTRGCCYTAFAGFSYYRNRTFRTWVHNYSGRNSGKSVYTAMLDDANLLYKACMDTQIGGSSDWRCTSLY